MRKTPAAPTKAPPANVPTVKAPAAAKTIAARPARAAKETTREITKEIKTESKQAKTIPVRAVPTPPVPIRVLAEAAGAGGRAWKMSGKHAVAYVHNAILAGELLETDPRRVAQSAMAVYYDRKGRPFAWQLRFDAARWDEVVARLA